MLPQIHRLKSKNCHTCPTAAGGDLQMKGLRIRNNEWLVLPAI
jgi:hypothetical protein